MTTKYNANMDNYTRYNNETQTQLFPTMYGRYQADYDYNGELDSDGDSADYYRPLKAVRVG